MRAAVALLMPSGGGGVDEQGEMAFISGEQGNKDQILSGTGEQRQFWGTGNIRNKIVHLGGTGEQAKQEIKMQK